MPLVQNLIEYQHEGCLLEGLFVEAEGEARGTVLVSPTWAGRDAFVEEKAHQLAELGYNAFALDMYGKGILGSNPEQNEQLMLPFLENRELLQQRQLAALDVVRQQSAVDADRIAAFGYCFGGLCLLDLVRTGADVRGIVSFHGMFSPPGNTEGNRIRAKVLVLHGYDDPLATPEELTALGHELTGMGADWQFHAYGNTAHAFTLPFANDPEGGAVYNETSDKRSWLAALNFLDEIFND